MSASNQQVTFDCGGVLNTNANVAGGAGLAAATLEASARATLSGTADEAASYASGEFVSPIVAMWNGTSGSAEDQSLGKFMMASLLHDWYARNPTATGGQLLHQVSGWALYRMTGTKFTQEAEASAKAGISIPLLTASGSVHGSFSRRTVFRGRDFELKLRADQTGKPLFVYPFDLPSRTDISSAISQNAAGRFVAKNDVVRSGIASAFDIEYRGMIRKYCHKSYTPSPSTSGVSLLGAEYIIETGKVPFCRFSLTYLRPTAPSGAGQHHVPFSLVNNSTPGGGLAPFTLPALALFQLTDRPKLDADAGYLQALTATVSAGPTGTRTTLTWRVPVRIEDDNEIDGPADVVVDRLAAVGCLVDGRRVSRYVVRRELRSRDSPVFQPMDLVVEATFSGDIRAENLAGSTCRLGGSILYSLRDGSIARSIDASDLMIRVPAPPAS